MVPGKALIQPEVHFDVDVDCNLAAIFNCRFEQPLVDSFDCLFIQSQAQRTNHVRIVDLSIRSDGGPHYHGALMFGFARFFREFRLGLELNSRRSYATANLENAATDSSSIARTNPASVARANAAAATFTNSRAVSSSV